MRDLAKSMFRFSWAMSMLGVRQMTHLLSPREGADRSASIFDAVSHAAEKEMGETVRNVYRAGDALQGGVVNAVAGAARGDLAGGSDQLGDAMKQTWENLDRSWTSLRQTVDSRPDPVD